MSDKKETLKEVEEQITKNIQETKDFKEKLVCIALNHHLERRKQLDEEYEKEQKLLMLKYENLALPINEEQNQIILGRPLKPEELANSSKYLNNNEESEKQTLGDVSLTIPEYWLKVLKNSDLIRAEIRANDEPVMKYLTSISVAKTDAPKQVFTLTFSFKENQYFSNATLQKKFFMVEDDDCDRTEGCKIDWKEGKNITVKTIEKTQKNKKTGQKRQVKKEVEEESFFNFFKNSGPPEADKIEDEEDEEKAEEKLQLDVDMGFIIKDDMIPYGLEYYLGVVRDNPDDDEMDEEDEEESKPQKKSKKGKKSEDSNA